MAKIVTLKDDLTQEVAYPQTKASAVYMDNGDTVQADLTAREQEVYDVIGNNIGVVAGEFSQSVILPGAVSGGVKGEVGESLTTTSSSSYIHYILSPKFGDRFYIGLGQSSSASYTHYIFAVDSRLVVLKTWADNIESSGQTFTDVTIPAGTKYLYILSNSALLMDVKKYVVDDLQSQINDKSVPSDFFKFSKNIFLGKFVKNKHLNNSGEYKDNEGNYATNPEFIPVNPTKQYAFSLNGEKLTDLPQTSSTIVCYYTAASEASFTRKVTYNSGYVLSPTGSEAYIRVEIATDSSDNLNFFAAATKYQIEEGTTITPWKPNKVVLNDYLDFDVNDIASAKFDADTALFEQFINNWTRAHYLNATFGPAEQASPYYTDIVSVINQKMADGCFVIAFATDTHDGGNFFEGGNSPERPIAVYNQLAALCDVAMHGGDITTHYGNTKLREMAFMRAAIKKFDVTVPFLITKGNHDERQNSYAEVMPQDIDFSKETYYVRDGSSMSAISESDWQGQDLYKVTPLEDISDREFKNIAQKWRCPTSAVWGSGAWFYYDDPDKEVRVIVLNSYPTADDGSSTLGKQMKWFAETALDLSDKDTPTDWAVVTLRHTKATGDDDFKSIINAFKGASSVSLTVGGVAISADYSAQGNGMYVGNLHGHNHALEVDTTDGYIDLGLPNSFCQLSDFGDVKDYRLTILSIDKENRKLYRNQINGANDNYSF